MVTRDSRGRSAHIADRAPTVKMRCDDAITNGIEVSRELGGIADASRPMSSVRQRLGPDTAEAGQGCAGHPNHTAMRRRPYRRKNEVANLGRRA